MKKMPLWSLQEIMGDRHENNLTSRHIGAICGKCCGGRKEGDMKAKHRGICWQAAQRDLGGFLALLGLPRWLSGKESTCTVGEAV